MTKKFLVAIDGSEQAWKALDLAIDIAKRSDAELSILHVVPYEAFPEGLKDFAKVEGINIEEERARFHAGRALADALTAEAAARAAKQGLERVKTLTAEGNASKEIVATANSEAADMLFMGSRGLGEVRGLLMGSVSHKVMNMAPCTCVAVK